MITVACAIIIKDNKILVCQRSSSMAMPLKWEFPGGKVEPGEDAAAAIVREIKEELHLDIDVLEQLERVEHEYPTFRIRLIPFVAQVVGGHLQLEEHADAKWVSATELDQYDWASADVPIVEQVKSRRYTTLFTEQ